MKARNFLKLFLGAQTVMTDDEFVMIMTTCRPVFFWVVQIALFALNVLPIAFFLYECLNTTKNRAETKRGSCVNKFRATFEHSILILLFNHLKFHL